MTHPAAPLLRPEVDEVARRFPLVPRTGPAQLPLPQQLAHVADLARTPSTHPAAAARIAAAHNLAALLASNCGRPGLARALCWRHHHRYVDRRPWTAVEARRALEPLVNLARLHRRAGDPDAAIDVLEQLLDAVHPGGIAVVDGRAVDLGDIFATDGDRHRTRRWLWSVTLAEGVRGLTRAGRWDDALAHALRHHGVGATLLDGRQVAVLAHAMMGGHTEAVALLADTVHAEPWQSAVADVLALVVARAAGLPIPVRPKGFQGFLAVASDTSVSDGFTIEVQLATAALIDGVDRSSVVSELIQRAATVTDAVVARAILSHPAGRHLPAPLLDRLAVVRDLAGSPGRSAGRWPTAPQVVRPGGAGGTDRG